MKLLCVVIHCGRLVIAALSTDIVEMASAELGKELECSICLTLYTDPVTLRCGHNFCRFCIEQMLIIQDGCRVYSCPECREVFQERPTLKRNITLCNVVENFRSMRGDDAPILCTYCVGSPVPAIKCCLLCEASLCDNHLRVHSKGVAHVLTDPSTSLGNRKCSVHKELLKYYCPEDATCICVSCYLIGEHRGHKLDSLEEALGKKKDKLGNVLQKLITNRNRTERRVQSLDQRRRKAQEKACGEAEKVNALFIDIRKRVEDLEKRVLSEIYWREEQVSLSLSDVIQNLEIKKCELSRKMRYIEELCNMTDPLTVLQDPDTSDLFDPEEEGGDEDTGGHYDDGGDEDTGGYNVGDRGADLISHISHTLSAMIIGVNVTFYVQDPADILLDVNTANNKMLISDDLKIATWTGINQNRPETEERFQCNQVMSGQRFTSGRHYWDVKISRSDLWRVGMCYPSIDRRGSQSIIGNNNKSWCLYGGWNQYLVTHNNKVFLLPHQISSDQFRICLDYEAGQLSFYELCGPVRHLYTFTATFTEPLHAVLCVYYGSIKISGGAVDEGPHHHRRMVL